MQQDRPLQGIFNVAPVVADSQRICGPVRRLDSVPETRQLFFAATHNLQAHQDICGFPVRQPAYCLKENGEAPFTRLLDGELDLSTPNEAYWLHVDWCFREAYRHGIVVLGFPAYIGWANDDQGVTSWLKASGVFKSARYGSFIGRRYSSYPNIIWAAGGDYPLASEEAEHDALWRVLVAAEAAEEGGIVHLVTAKSRRDISALEDPSYAKDYLTLNSTYSRREITSSEARDDYDRRVDGSPLPSFYIEGYYENEHDMTALELRQQAFWALLEGNCGQIYGNCPVWSFGGADDFCDVSGMDVSAAYDSVGASQMSHLARLFSVRNPIWTGGAYLEVDRGELVSAGKGEVGSTDYVPARYNSRVAVLYLPQSKSVTIEFSLLVGVEGEVRVAWFRPDSGEVFPAENLKPGGSREMTPPSAGDWVLLLDDTELGLVLP